MSGVWHVSVSNTDTCGYIQLIQSFKIIIDVSVSVSLFTWESRSGFNSFITPFASYLYALFSPTTWLVQNRTHIQQDKSKNIVDWLN
jgi:hypothetical protein